MKSVRGGAGGDRGRKRVARKKPSLKGKSKPASGHTKRNPRAKKAKRSVAVKARGRKDKCSRGTGGKRKLVGIKRRKVTLL